MLQLHSCRVPQLAFEWLHEKLANLLGLNPQDRALLYHSNHSACGALDCVKREADQGFKL